METRILTLFDDEFFPPDPPKEKPKKEKAPKPSADKTVASDETGNSEKDIIAEALNEFHEKELQETAANETATHQETVATKELETDETNTTSPEVIASSETVLEEAYNDIIVEETLMADDIHFDVSQEPVFAEDEVEPIVYSDDIAEDMATEEDIITSMEEENDVVDDIVENDVVDEIKNVVDKITNEDATGEEEAKDEISADATNDINKSEPLETIAYQASQEDKDLNQQILSELIQLDYTALMQKDYAFDLNNATVINKELPKTKPQPEPIAAVQEEEQEEEVFEDVTPLPEWKLDKKYYTIGEVATLFEVNTSHIRFWTNEFKLRPRTTRKGDRLYSPKDIAELRLIHHLVKVKKHTIKGAREKLKAEKTDVNNKLDLKESLLQLKDTLMKIREQL